MRKIIGTGLLATSFGNRDSSRPVLILASGVSNSGETHESAFERERNLVAAAIDGEPDLVAVYLSTCSIDSSADSCYIQHKLDMERLVARLATRYFIFRLPQVVGPVMNATLVSSLAALIAQGRPVTVQTRAVRNLIDVADAVRIAYRLIDDDIGANSIQTIASGCDVSAAAIVHEVAAILDVEPAVICVDKGEPQTPNVSSLKFLLGQGDPIFHPEYWRLVLRKYVPYYRHIAPKIGSPT